MIRSGRYSAEQKLQLLRRHRRGEQLDLGADKHGRDLLAKWEARAPADLADEEALARLQWTEDDGEIPTLAVLRQQAGPFPTAFLRPGMRVLSLFCARFYGCSDVVRVHDSGPAHLTLVDTDAAKLDEMRLIYPADWDYVTADYRQYLDLAVSQGKRFDVVIADPWRWMSEDIAWKRLPDIMDIAPLFIVNYFDTMLTGLGVVPEDLAGISKILTERVGYPINALEIQWRNREVAWGVIADGRHASAQQRR